LVSRTSPKLPNNKKCGYATHKLPIRIAGGVGKQVFGVVSAQGSVV